MKKRIIIYLLLIFTNSSLFGQRIYESTWIDKRNEMTLITIEKENGKFWLKFYEKRFKIYKPKNPFILFRGKKSKIEIDHELGNLTLNGKKYIPEFKSRKRTFLGRWKSTSKNTIFDIRLINDMIVWDIIKDKDKPIRFYPKLTDNGFTFTFGEKQLFFLMKNGKITYPLVKYFVLNFLQKEIY